MSRRRQAAARVREPGRVDFEQHEPTPTGEAGQGPSPAPPASGAGSAFKMSMVLWGFPLVAFIVVAILKSQCGA